MEKLAAGDFITRELQTRNRNTVFVLYHSIVWQYIAASEQHGIVATMQAAGQAATETSPLAWLRLEPGEASDGADLLLTLWPSGETRRLAVGDYHGRWVRWLA